MTIPLEFYLSPAHPPQIPQLARISSQAFKTDSHTQLKTAATGIDHAEDMRSALEMWIALPRERCQVITAVVGEEVVGWCCWVFKGLEGPEIPPPLPATSEEKNSKLDTSSPRPVPRKIKELGDLTDKAMLTHISTHFPPTTPHLILCAITILPEYQSCGLGSALMSYGTEYADRKGVYSWVSASPAGAAMFAKRGYVEVGRHEVDLDLDEYAVGDDGGRVRNEEREDGGWGVYCWRWMRREVGGGK